MDQFAPFIVTILGIVFTDLLTGIGLGMAVSVFVILSRSYMNSHFLHISESQSATGRRVVSIHLAEDVTFLNKGAIIRSLADMPDGVHVCIDSSRSFHVAYDVLEAIAEFEESAPARNISVERVESEPSPVGRMGEIDRSSPHAHTKPGVPVADDGEAGVGTPPGGE
ncbi:MAG: hypothetical protein P8R42_13620 [Candidatus Binatia bacterium]|nr:hypothetical protein [Candidatus Binatia bacterium]